MQIIFDKNTVNERIFNASEYSEDLLLNVLFAKNDYSMDDLPDKKSLPTKDFKTIAYEEDGKPIPTMGQYVTLKGLTVNYNSKNKVFTYSIELGE